MEHPYTIFGALFGVAHENLALVTAGFVVLLLIVAAGVLYPRIRNARANLLPEARLGLKTVFELFVEMLAGLCDDIIGPHGRKYLPFVGTVFFFILACNLIGMIPGFLPPTENALTGAAVATIVLIAFNYFGFREHGWGYLKHFLAPIPVGPTNSVLRWILIMVPMVALHGLFAGIELVGMLFRPVSLSIRLFANVFGDHMVLGIFSGLIPYVIPLPFIVLGIFVSFMQAFIFMLLTMVYISGAVAHEH